jgi:hypothetical protein
VEEDARRNGVVVAFVIPLLIVGGISLGIPELCVHEACLALRLIVLAHNIHVEEFSKLRRLSGVVVVFNVPLGGGLANSLATLGIKRSIVGEHALTHVCVLTVAIKRCVDGLG